MTGTRPRRSAPSLDLRRSTVTWIARGHFGRNGARPLLEHKARLSRELRAWLVELGVTPRTRAEWAARLGGAGLGAEIRARLKGDRS